MKLYVYCSRLKYVCLVLVFFQSSTLYSQSSKEVQLQKECQEIQTVWLTRVLNLTKITVGNSAPVAARNLMYFNVAMYEAALLSLPENASLSGQLSNYERTVWPKINETLSAQIVQVVVANSMVNYLYENIPPAQRKITSTFYEAALNKLIRKEKKELISRSIKFGEELARELIEWSKLDGGDKSYQTNFPESYQLPNCDSCWVRTFPGYKNALQPYWGKNQLMLKGNGTQCEGIPFIGFSTDSNSLIFKDAINIYELFTQGDYSPEMKVIAEYWNDEPGFSGTPVGHLYTLALQLSENRGLSFQENAEMLTCLGIAINDAVIETFRLKYAYNLLRPITYIEKYIGKNFNSLIPSPSFPEFPSGHSLQSGAGCEVLKAFLGDDFSYTDSTNMERMDIDGSPRTFNNVSAMAEEISLSRFYGGIHFMTTLNTSLHYGRKIGTYTFENLQFRK